MSDDPPPPDFTVTSELPLTGRATTASISPDPPRFPGDLDDDRAAAADAPGSAPDPDGLFGPWPILDVETVPDRGSPPPPIVLEGAILPYEVEAATTGALGRLRAALATGRDHVEPLYRRQAAVGGAVLLILAVVVALTFPRSWSDPDPGLPVEAGTGDDGRSPDGDARSTGGLVEPVSTAAGEPASPTAQRLTARRVTGASGPAPTVTVAGAKPTTPPVETVTTTAVAGPGTSVAIGGCSGPVALLGCDGGPPVTVAATTGASATVGPIEEPTTTAAGRLVTSATPVRTTVRRATTTTLRPATTAQATTTTAVPTTATTTTTTTSAPTTTAPPAESSTLPTQVANCTPNGAPEPGLPLC